MDNFVTFAKKESAKTKDKLKCRCGASIKCDKCSIKFSLKSILDSFDFNRTSPTKKNKNCPHEVPEFCSHC